MLKISLFSLRDPISVCIHYKQKRYVPEVTRGSNVIMADQIEEIVINF